MLLVVTGNMNKIKVKIFLLQECATVKPSQGAVLFFSRKLQE